MVEDTPEAIEPSADSGRAKRAPPTIDLKAVEVTDETPSASPGESAEPEPPPPRPSRGISAGVIGALSGASTAALVLAAAWFAGWPATTPPTPQTNTAVIDDLAARIAGVESKTATPPISAPDPAVAGRVDGVEKSVASLRGELAGLRAQSDKPPQPSAI